MILSAASSFWISIINLFTGWRSHPQNLRDSEYEIERTFYNFRNWNRSNGHSYQFVWEKNPFHHPITFELNFSRKRLVKIHLDFLGFRLFYNFADIEGRAYGFSFYDSSNALVIHWGYGSGFNIGPEGGFSKWIRMPWDYEHKVTRIIAKNGKWIDSLGWELDKLVIKKEEFPYTYTLKSGEIQNRTAKVSVNRMVWLWRMFHKFNIGPKIDRTSIDVEFSDEVGERTGSWKGGTTGCSYEMKKGETPEQALRRMELERKF